MILHHVTNSFSSLSHILPHLVVKFQNVPILNSTRKNFRLCKQKKNRNFFFNYYTNARVIDIKEELRYREDTKLLFTQSNICTIYIYTHEGICFSFATEVVRAKRRSFENAFRYFSRRGDCFAKCLPQMTNALRFTEKPNCSTSENVTKRASLDQGSFVS